MELNAVHQNAVIGFVIKMLEKLKNHLNSITQEEFDKEWREIIMQNKKYDRGICVETGKYVYGYDVGGSCVGYHLYTCDEDQGETFIEIIPDSFSKNTGRLDKNNEMIFAGDKFKFKFMNNGKRDSIEELVGSFEYSYTNMAWWIKVENSREYYNLNYMVDGHMESFELLPKEQPFDIEKKKQENTLIAIDGVGAYKIDEFIVSAKKMLTDMENSKLFIKTNIAVYFEFNGKTIYIDKLSKVEEFIYGEFLNCTSDEYWIK